MLLINPSLDNRPCTWSSLSPKPAMELPPEPISGPDDKSMAVFLYSSDLSSTSTSYFHDGARFETLRGAGVDDFAMGTLLPTVAIGSTSLSRGRTVSKWSFSIRTLFSSYLRDETDFKKYQLEAVAELRL
ncbi:hypothetical protein H0H93_010767 [Arthromyces matolae]|nr:hypothetical protein H0H93_010767 [Arthromyces matolae]